MSPAGDVSCKMYKLTDHSDCKLQNTSDVVELLGRSHRGDLALGVGKINICISSHVKELRFEPVLKFTYTLFPPLVHQFFYLPTFNTLAKKDYS